MKSNTLSKWFKYSRITKFFANFDGFCKDILSDNIEYAKLIKCCEKEELLQEYDDLFKGTNADIYIPLWASVCKYDDGYLMDKTTLAIINTYQKWGYAPVFMDGNPPDFIGQQTRFLCYMSAAAIHADDGIEYKDAIENFVREYLFDTARVVARGIKENSENPFFQAVAEDILNMISAKDIAADNEFKEIPSTLECYDFVKTGRAPEIAQGEEKRIYTAGRNNCGGKCSIIATVKDGCLLNIETGCDIGEPSIRACVRGRGYRHTYLKGERLRYPMKRIGERGEGRFKRISWQEAAKIIADETIRIKQSYGVGSRYVNYSTGIRGIMNAADQMRKLLNLDGGFLGYYGSYSSINTSYTTPFIYGDAAGGNSVESLEHSKYIILWAHNPTETIFSPQLSYTLVKAKEKGAKVIVIDPRNSDTAVALADEWVGIKPSTDGALAVAMTYVIWSEGLQDQNFMDRYCLGFDAEHMPDGVDKELNYKNYIFGITDGIPKTPEWGERITGVPAETIRRIAREFGKAKPACLLPGLGHQRVGNGEQTVRAFAALACLTGNIGIIGGGSAGCGFTEEEPKPVYHIGENNYKGVISVFLWTKAVECGSSMTRKEDHIQGMEKLDSNIKQIFNIAGNSLVNQHSDINYTTNLLRDMSKCEFIVGSDVFMTASAKYFDILLPAPSFLEENSISVPWSMGHYIVYHNKTINPIFGCRTEFDWISDVAEAMGHKDGFTEGKNSKDEWVKHIYDELCKKNDELPSYEEFRKKGGYTYKNIHTYIAYEKQIKDPKNNKFKTPSGKIEIFSKQLLDMNKDEIPALPIYTPTFEGPEDPLIETYPLQLIGWHTKRRCHSIHDNNKIMEEVEPQAMWINPKDATARGIKDGDTVEVFNLRGKIHMPVKVTNRIVAGVVAIAQGAWYTPNKNGIDERGSINVLTTLRPTPLAKGNPQHTNLVEVKALCRK